MFSMAPAEILFILVMGVFPVVAVLFAACKNGTHCKNKS